MDKLLPSKAFKRHRQSVPEQVASGCRETVGRFNRRQKLGGGERHDGQSAGGLQSPSYGVYKEQRGIFNGLVVWKIALYRSRSLGTSIIFIQRGVHVLDMLQIKRLGHINIICMAATKGRSI